MKRHASRAVNTRKMTASFFLALVFLISLNTVVSAEEKTEITVYPGQTVRNNELWFENIGGIPFYDVYAVASGPAADWVSPTTIYFGTVYSGQKVTKTYTIKVPEDAIVGQDYTLTWKYYSEEGYEGSWHGTIHVTSRPLIPWWIWIVVILVAPGMVIAISGIPWWIWIPAIAILGIVIGVVSRKSAREKPVARICPQCGRTLPLDVKFCPYCGKTLGE